MSDNKTIAITGATGSLGQELVAQMLPKFNIIAISRDERKQAQMQQRFRHVNYVIADVRDSKALLRSFRNIDYVIHCAAMKRIDSCGDNPLEAISTNILGAQNVIDAAVHNGVKKVLAISSDKACHPSNVYGASKLCADYLFIHANSGTRFSTVRMGNFYGSRGSVQEYWDELWYHGERKLPLTHPDMTRFYIRLKDAAKFTIQCLEIMNGGEIFTPKMERLKITSLAPIDAEFIITGIRNGEKLHEKLITAEDARNTIERDDFYVTFPNGIPDNVVGIRVSEGFEYTSG